jgi:hypothetical protein
MEIGRKCSVIGIMINCHKNFNFSIHVSFFIVAKNGEIIPILLFCDTFDVKK